MRAARWARQRVADAAVGGERGASLVLALAFLTFFGVLLLALVGFVQAAVLANGRVHKQGLGQYAMAGAIDADIHRARKDPTMGVSTCNPLTYGSVNVACSVQRGDGGLRPGVGVPLNAILTVGGGITNNAAGSTMTVAGPIYANGPITLAPNSKLDVEDLPVTGTTCGSNTSIWKYSQPIVSCPPIDGKAPPAGVGTAPSYASSLPDAALGTPVKPADVACAGSGGGQYWDYKPGYYNDVTALTAPTATCSAKARYFGPGVYYFDFGRDCAAGTAACATQWSISGLPVIGGAATGWLGSGSPPAAPTPTNPDATATACNPDSAGVQFVFGGASTAFVAAGARVELCSGPGQILMYGQLSSPAAAPQVLRPADVSPLPPNCPATITATGSPCWRNEGGGTFTKDRVLAIDGSRAQALVTEGGTDPLTMTGFPAAPTTWGTNFDMAIRIAHAEVLTDASGALLDTNGNGTAIFLKIVSSAGSCELDLTKFPQQVFNDAGQVTTFTKNADPQNKYDACKLVVAQPFTITYDPRFPARGAQDTVLRSALDGIDVTFTPTLAYPRALQPGGIPVLDVASGAKFAAWGTVYMTNADFRVDISGDVIFDRGVILKSLAANGGRDGAANFRLGGGRRTMLLEATSGSRRVRALVTVTDYDGPGYWARIKRWDVSR